MTSFRATPLHDCQRNFTKRRLKDVERQKSDIKWLNKGTKIPKMPNEFKERKWRFFKVNQRRAIQDIPASELQFTYRLFFRLATVVFVYMIKRILYVGAEI